LNILEVRNLTVWFPRKSSLLRRTIGHVKAVTGVAFVIPTGKTVGLVGESGSGKTTVGMAIMNLVSATEGNILFRGRDITNLPEKEFRPMAAFAHYQSDRVNLRYSPPSNAPN
jgi:ABC-type oligopeptide transport system ATPase subunit